MVKFLKYSLEMLLFKLKSLLDIKVFLKIDNSLLCSLSNFKSSHFLSRNRNTVRISAILGKFTYRDTKIILTYTYPYSTHFVDTIVDVRNEIQYNDCQIVVELKYNSYSKHNWVIFTKFSCIWLILPTCRCPGGNRYKTVDAAPLHSNYVFLDTVLLYSWAYWCGLRVL